MKVETVKAVENMPYSEQKTRRETDRKGDCSLNSSRSVKEHYSKFGISEQELTPCVRDALVYLTDQIDDLRVSLMKAREQIADLEELADRDTLTPVLNRRAFVRELQRWTAHAARYKQPLSLIFFDVDDMKGINDRMSHAAGDAALLALSDCLIRLSRSSDLVGRLGGDEFGMLAPHTDFVHAQETAARLAHSITSEQRFFEGRAIPLSVSYGVHRIEPGEEPEAALARADRIMYADKARKHMAR